MLKRLIMLVVLASLVFGVSSTSSRAGGPGQCAFTESITANGTTVTAIFHVVTANCQVSLVGVSYFGGATTMVDSATGTFSPGFYQLQVHLPCGTNTEADLILGPPALFPPASLDLRAVAFFFPCASALTRTQGYWKNHPDAWPVQSITLGGSSYSKSQAIAILQTPPAGGNATLILVHQLIAAQLNVAAGADSSCITSTIAAANAWLAANGGANGTVKAGSAAGQTATALANTLDQYNNGKLCAAGG